MHPRATSGSNQVPAKEGATPSQERHLWNEAPGAGYPNGNRCPPGSVPSQDHHRRRAGGHRPSDDLDRRDAADVADKVDHPGPRARVEVGPHGELLEGAVAEAEREVVDLGEVL